MLFRSGLADASGDNVLSILVRNMGHSLDLLANERHKQPRGLVSASLAGSPAPIAWRIQGSQGGESPADPVRGPMNNGGLYGERAGWSLPGYPDAGWTPVGLPFSDPLPGVAWYRTTFEMHVPAGVDASIGLTIDDPPSKAYRAQVFLNGWNVGQYINDIGPQHTFVLPNGLLRAGSRNTLAIAVISNQPGSGGLGSVSLTALGAAAGGVGVSPVTSPGFEPPRLGGLPVSAEAGTAFSGPVATLRLPASPRGAALLPSIDWGDGSTSTGTVGAGREGLVVSGRHSYGRAGRFQVRVTLSDPYDATTLAEASTTATVTTVPTGPSARSRAPASAAGPR